MEHQPNDDVLLTQQVGAVRILTLNRPARSNALDASLLSSLIDALLQADADAGVAVLIVTGAGDRAFCAGADIKAVAESDHAGQRDPRKLSGGRRNLFELILELRKPVVAAVNGVAAGGGFELALACDLRVAEQHARFVSPEAKRGMGAHFASVVLPRLIPEAIAFEMLFTGEPLTAADALRWGLLNRMVPTGAALAAATELATLIAENAPLSVRRMKAMGRRSAGMPLAAALRLDEGPSPYESDDRVEGFRAFAEKRKPQWRGR